MCDLKLPFGENNYPVFTLPPEIKTKVEDNVEYLKHLCIEGLEDRYDETYLPEEDRSEETDEQVKELSERIDYELSVIGKTGFNDYFLIVADFMGWAREQGYSGGTGRRGSDSLPGGICFWVLQILILFVLVYCLNDSLIGTGFSP